MNRRNFIKVGAIGTLGVASQAMAGGQRLAPDPPTPAETEGPFYPVVARKDRDFDLTRIRGRDGEALGEHIFVHGEVFDTEGNPVEDATVDLWQANAAGRYTHPHDSNPAPVDENFQGWAIVASGRDGGFRCKTVFPGAYPAQGEWLRPPHIHFKVTKKGYIELTTQMYFPNQPLNRVDRLLQKKSKEEQARMIAERSPDNPDTFYYRIVIQKV